MSIPVKSLNSAGVDIFCNWLKSGHGAPPMEILENDQYCDDIAGSYFIDFTRTFDTSFELGKYLHNEVFVGPIDTVKLTADCGMWAWISLALIKNLLARTAARGGKPLDSAHYVEQPSQQGRRLGYRLIARTAWRVVRTHGDAAAVAIGSRRSPWGEMAEQMTSRQEIFSHPSFWSVAYRLYRSANGELRRGATSQRPETARRDPNNRAGRGGVRRLPMTFRQFDRTYDVRRMTLDEMLSVLPDEYASWKNPK